MDYLGLISFCMVFTLVYIIARGIAFSNKNIEKSKKKFLDMESNANTVRRADISKLNYLSIPYEELAFDKISSSIDEKDKLYSCVKELKALDGKRIIDLSAYTNTELKLMYGPANLEDLSSYDANFTTLIRNLDALGNGLIANGNAETGVKLLEYAIHIGSDLTNTYMGLSDIYVLNKDKHALRELIKKADKITSLLGPNIKLKLENKLHKL